MDYEGSRVRYRKSNQCWLVLVGCCIICAVGCTIPTTCWTVCMASMIQDVGLTYTQGSMYMAAVMSVSTVSLILAPKLIYYGAGKLVAISGALCGCGFFIIAAYPSTQTIVAAGVIVGLSYMPASLYTAPVVIKNWFAKRQGTFTAIALAWTGVGGIVFSLLASSLVETFNWRVALIVLGCITIISQVIVGAFMIRLSPIPLGILPYGACEISSPDDLKENPGLSLSESFKTPTAWLMLVVLVCLGIMTTVITNVNPMYQKFGFTVAASGLALSACSFGNITGKLFMGWITDKKGAQFGCLVGALMAITGLAGNVVSFTILPNECLLYVSAFICGNGSCMATMMPPLVTMGAFGPKNYDHMYGFFSAIRALTAAAVTLLVGMMVDITGSYISTIALWIGACAVVIPFAFACIKSGQKRWKK